MGCNNPDEDVDRRKKGNRAKESLPRGYGWEEQKATRKNKRNDPMKGMIIRRRKE